MSFFSGGSKLFTLHSSLFTFFCTFAPRKVIKTMNYEELLESKSPLRAKLATMSLGRFTKVQLEDGKCQNVLAIRPQLNDSIVFAEALKSECEKNKELMHKHQLHFEPELKGNNIVSLHLEQGNYVTLAQLVQDQPSIVGTKGFISTIIQQLLDVTEYLHEQQVWHVCYAPQNILVRKGDNAVMLLTHGSFYLGMKNRMDLYEGMEDFIAPEIRNDGTVDNRCDIYSLGKLISWLFEMTESTYDYRKIAKKAQSEMPEGRYESITDMRKALASKRELRRSWLTLLAAAIVALILVGGYFMLMPEPTTVEFVKPAPRQATDDLIEDGFDPAELGVVSGDSLVMTPEERRQQKEYEAKAEQIFRKRFTAEADRILSKIYDNEHMNSSEKKFMAEMSSVNEELLQQQLDIATEAGISTARSQVLATEIVETLTEQKKKKLQYYGVQK